MNFLASRKTLSKKGVDFPRRKNKKKENFAPANILAEEFLFHSSQAGQVDHPEDDNNGLMPSSFSKVCSRYKHAQQTSKHFLGGGVIPTTTEKKCTFCLTKARHNEIRSGSAFSGLAAESSHPPSTDFLLS